MCCASRALAQRAKRGGHGVAGGSPAHLSALKSLRPQSTMFSVMSTGSPPGTAEELAMAPVVLGVRTLTSLQP